MELTDLRLSNNLKFLRKTFRLISFNFRHYCSLLNPTKDVNFCLTVSDLQSHTRIHENTPLWLWSFPSIKSPFLVFAIFLPLEDFLDMVLRKCKDRGDVQYYFHLKTSLLFVKVFEGISGISFGDP